MIAFFHVIRKNPHLPREGTETEKLFIFKNRKSCKNPQSPWEGAETLDNLKEINNIIMLETPVSSREGTETFCLGTIPSLAFLLETPFTSRGYGNSNSLVYLIAFVDVSPPNHLKRERKRVFNQHCLKFCFCKPPVTSRGYGNHSYALSTILRLGKKPQSPREGTETFQFVLYQWHNFLHNSPREGAETVCWSWSSLNRLTCKNLHSPR